MIVKKYIFSFFLNKCRNNRKNRSILNISKIDAAKIKNSIQINSFFGNPLIGYKIDLSMIKLIKL